MDEQDEKHRKDGAEVTLGDITGIVVYIEAVNDGVRTDEEERTRRRAGGRGNGTRRRIVGLESVGA
ncbi:hypothetical protein, partial [Halobellus sp. EA9]|uniref:hypothetical protein n=1 Tax=Halobellus sp. EA9 TaxID=3421647 RepID=UPI003EBFB48F